VAGPCPLYKGITFVSRQDMGGSYVMALSFRKVVMHAMPVVPKCLSTYSGILLNPELLFALKWWWMTEVSSACVMKFAASFLSGVNSSGGISAL
jgi:hypothetical protein